MGKTADSYDKVAEISKKKADRAWAQAKNGEPWKFKVARSFYETVKRAKEKAKELRGQ